MSQGAFTHDRAACAVPACGHVCAAVSLSQMHSDPLYWALSLTASCHGSGSLDWDSIRTDDPTLLSINVSFYPVYICLIPPPLPLSAPHLLDGDALMKRPPCVSISVPGVCGSSNVVQSHNGLAHSLALSGRESGANLLTVGLCFLRRLVMSHCQCCVALLFFSFFFSHGA